MKTDKYNYYMSQLKKVDYHSEYCPIIKIQGGNENQQTNWMDLNNESARVIVLKLMREFSIKLDYKTGLLINK